VGIPARVVKVRSANDEGRGLDLDHHLIPDPVGKAIACLLERIDTLELRLQNLSTNKCTSEPQEPWACEPDNEICEQQCPVGVRLGT
jgi:serine O-acetyltransferase